MDAVREPGKYKRGKKKKYPGYLSLNGDIWTVLLDKTMENFPMSVSYEMVKK